MTLEIAIYEMDYPILLWCYAEFLVVHRWVSLESDALE